MSHHRVSLIHVHPMSLRPWLLFSLFGLCLVLQADPTCARPATADEVESQLAAERQRALTQGVATVTDAERAKSTAATRTADLEADLTTDKAALAGLQKELLAVLATDNSTAIKVIRTRLAARQAAFDAVEGEKALVQKEAEEAESEREVWKKRATTLELSLRMDMKVMLASPADVESCEKRVDAASKEIASQVGQIQKYVSRRDKAALELSDLSKRLRLWSEGAGISIFADLQHACDEEVRQLQRQVVLQRGWFVLNHKLEQRARRNLAFARTDYLVSRRYADALARKSALWRADEAQVGAEQADAQLASMRTALAPVQRRAFTELAEAARQTEAALKTLGEARTAQEQELAHSAYGSAQVRRSRWEAESDCWKEFLALQKAGAAFAHELADRARGMAEDRNILEINREEQMLREGLRTSAEFVRSLQTMVQTPGDLIESARRELGLTPEEVASLATPMEDLFGDLDASHPPATDLVFDKIQEIIGRVPGESAGTRMTVDQRCEVGARLVVRLAQREMLRVRETISERWLHNSQASIQALERVAGTTLWRQNDPRLNDITCEELGTMIGTMASDLGFAWDCCTVG